MVSSLRMSLFPFCADLYAFSLILFIPLSARLQRLHVSLDMESI